ncbi:hypothetical protein OPV22_009547 [Ensete ventricosum]|uniref:Uncharacterized protein n=1 Tax=Ensete ventricosum TaxID=4639 RepID=A0AAV8PZU9_ENSVE|nr:hypothetical protein OPV22_009547 [Ensete ventricosum]
MPHRSRTVYVVEADVRQRGRRTTPALAWLRCHGLTSPRFSRKNSSAVAINSTQPSIGKSPERRVSPSESATLTRSNSAGSNRWTRNEPGLLDPTSPPTAVRWKASLPYACRPRRGA